MKIFGTLFAALAGLIIGISITTLPAQKPKLVLVQHVVVCNKPQGDILVASNGDSQEAEHGSFTVPKGVLEAILTIPCQGSPT